MDRLVINLSKKTFLNAHLMRFLVRLFPLGWISVVFTSYGYSGLILSPGEGS